MALHGSATANISPILTKFSNRIRSVNLIIHQDESGSMNSYSTFFTDGNVIEQIQNTLISNGIGNLVDAHPNLYAYFDNVGRDPLNSFSISGTLSISQSFMRGESTGATTKTQWISNYVSRKSSHSINLLDTGSLRSEDVHGNLWSIHTSPNSISSGTAGRYGSVISNSIRQNSRTFVVTNSNAQAQDNRINQSIVVSTNPQTTRTINGSSGEMIFRGYRIIAISSYDSSDEYAGVLFYGSTSPQPYGYITLSATDYSEVRSATAPNWTRQSGQRQDTLTLASETRGALFKLNISLQTNKIGFAKCIADFISKTT